MSRYFTRRLAVALPTLFGISLVCFFLVQLTPGGPVEQAIAEMTHAGIAGDSGGSARLTAITEEQREALVAYYGFDKPLFRRYVAWIAKVARLDFGDSYRYNEPVATLVGRALPVSLLFGFASFLFAHLVSLPLGVAKAARNGSRFDAVSSAALLFLYAIPSFALGIVLIVLFAGGSHWNWFPAQGLTSENFADLGLFGKCRDLVWHMILPLACYTVGSFASLTFLMRNSLLEEMGKEYVIAARAKGLAERTILLRHSLRNALLPVAHGLGQWLSIFFTGSLLIETIFGLQGVGRLSFDAIVGRDYPVVLAVILCLSGVQIAGNLLSDMLYVYLDPRIDYRADYSV